MAKSNSILILQRTYGEIRRASDERAAAKRDGITLSNRTSRSGRTMIWCATPDAVVIKFTRDNGTFKYRDCRVNWTSRAQVVAL